GETMSTNRSAISSGFIALVLAVISTTACASITPIGDLNSDAAKYSGKTVTIAGTVQGGAGGLGVGEYQVRDDTGPRTVVSANGNPSAPGTKIRVKGVCKPLATVGSSGVSVLKEESRETD